MERFGEPRTCEETLPLLAAYHAGELLEGTSRTVEAHLAECAACRGELEYTVRALAAIAEMRQAGDVSDLSLQRLRQTAREGIAKQSAISAQRQRTARSFAYRFAAAAGILIALVAGKLIFSLVYHAVVPSAPGARPPAPVAQAPSVPVKQLPGQPPAVAQAAPEQIVVPSQQTPPASALPATKPTTLKTGQAKTVKHFRRNPDRSRQYAVAALWRQADDPVDKKLAQIADEIETKFASAPAQHVSSAGWNGIDSDIGSISSDLSNVEEQVDEL